ncbi:recombinase family protein [Nocardia otitidiscaviarum]|uniref:recombinase family protein n=1 Tax=Nocardia otitidiscaviarum TaxID=1823 RepID=UPI001895F217|nr:recombinase family protein [Nocardia otitidiscaviarum]MBF6132808.1 recombinase family protein [Nocardia otitidiscaviarum]
MSLVPVRAAIYLRVSLDSSGDGLAVERQLEDCTRIAEARGWSVCEIYTEKPISAFDKNRARPAYDRMVEDYRAGRFNALITWDLDRLTRQPRQLEDWIDAAESNGLRLVTANGEADLQTDGGRMYARIKAAVARAEMERKGARQSRAHKQRAEKGIPPRGIRAVGYTSRGELVPEEAEVIREVFHAFANGTSLRALAAALSGAKPAVRQVGNYQVKDLPTNVRPLPSRNGRPWHVSTVRHILRNPRYAGWSMLGGEILRDKTGAPVRGQWEPVVSDGVWMEVQRRLDDPARITNRAGTERRHLGTGLYICGLCGDPLLPRVKVNLKGYLCKGHLSRSRRQVDAFVLEYIRLRLAQPDLAQLLTDTDDDRTAELAQAEQVQRDRIDRARADYKAELIDGDLYKEIREEAEAEAARLEAERLTITAGTTASAILSAPSPVDAFDMADLAAKRAVIDLLCEVWLWPSPRGRQQFDPTTVEIRPK